MTGRISGRTSRPDRPRHPALAKKAKPPAAASDPTRRLRRAIGNHGALGLLESGGLAVSHPKDRDEREAEQVADRIMRMPDSGVQRQADHSHGAASRSAALKGPPSSTPAPGGGGEPLPPSSRSYFEPRFGHDFGSVRVHADTDAAAAAQAINAQAFTLGRDVYFADGRYAPDTRPGQRLLAHELTHVVQQSKTHAPRLQRFTAEQDGDRVFINPESGDTDRDLDRVLCPGVTDRRIAGRTRIDVTACFPAGTIAAMSLPTHNCAEFVRQAIGQTRPESLNAEWLLTGKLWEELFEKGFQVRSFGIVKPRGQIEPINSLTWKQLAPQMGEMVFMMGGVMLNRAGAEPDPKGDNFRVSWDHVGLFVVRSRDGIDYHLAKDGDENPIGMYHTGTEPAEWEAPGAYVKGAETLIAYIGLLSPEEAASQERYVPREMSEQFWKLPEAERGVISQETDRRFAEQTGVTRRLDRESAADQPLHWQWLRIRDEVTGQHIAKTGASKP